MRARLRAKYLPAIERMLEGELLGGDLPPIVRLRARLVEAQAMLSGSTDGTVQQFRSLSADLENNPLLNRPPSPRFDSVRPSATFSSRAVTATTAIASGATAAASSSASVLGSAVPAVSSTLADPAMLRVGASLLNRLRATNSAADAVATPPLVEPPPAVAAVEAAHGVLLPEDDDDLPEVYARLCRLMYGSGDFGTPAAESLPVVVEHLVRWLRDGVISRVLQSIPSGAGLEARQLRQLRRQFPAAWADMANAESGHRLAQLSEGDNAAPHVLAPQEVSLASAGEAPPQADGAPDRREATRPGGDDGGGARAEAEGENGGGVGDEATTVTEAEAEAAVVAGAESRAVERRRFADARTALMSESEYEAFAALRVHSRLGCKAFARLCARHVCGGGMVDAPPPDTRGERLRPVARFLAKLCADRVGELVDLANRSTHAGSLAVPEAPIAPARYREASEALLARAESMVAPEVRKRSYKRAASQDAPRDNRASASAALLARGMGMRWQPQPSEVTGGLPLPLPDLPLPEGMAAASGTRAA